jgi:6-bladed beta-propeller
MGRVERTVASRLIIVVSLAASACDAKSGHETIAPSASRGGNTSLLMDSVGLIGLEHLFTIGTVDGEAEYAFGRVESVTARDDAGFYVCDGQDTQLRSYDSTGRFVANIGRNGRGPAEYLTCGPVLLSADTVAISDVFTRRVVRFGLDGSRGDTRTVPTGYSAVALRADGAMWVLETRPGRAPDERSWNVMVLFSPAGQPVDSFEVPSGRRPVGFQTLVTATENGALNPRLEDSLLAIVPSGGVLVATAADYRIDLRHASFARTLSRDIPALEYSRAERDEWRRILEEFPAQPQLPLPDRKPHIRALRADEVGRAWVQVADTAYRREPAPDPPGAARRPRLSYIEQSVWDLFDLQQGDYIGRLRLPRGHSLKASRGDRIWLVSAGEDGELLLSVYRLRANALP